jgi:hypothetical protein
MKESPLVSVEVIKEGDKGRVIEALVTEPLADVGPVFLFDMSVVIFVVGTGASKLDGMFSLCEVLEEMIIEELTSIVAIEAKEGEGQGVFNMVDLLEDIGFAFSPDRSLFRPTGGDIHAVNGIGEHSG